MPNRVVYRIILVLFQVSPFICANGLYAGSELLASRLKNEIEIGAAMDILEDKTGTLTFAGIRQREAGLPFFPSPGNIVNYGYSASDYWLRFTIRNDLDHDREYTLVYNYALIGELDLFSVFPDQTVAHAEGGLYRPFALRSHQFRNPNFRLKAVKGVNRYYLKIRTLSPVNIYPVLHEYSSLVAMINNEQIVYGIYFGTVFVIAFYNLFMFLVLREKNYLYYILFAFFWLAFSYSYGGFARQYLWPDAPWQMMYSTMTSLGLGVFFIVQFSVHYLGLREKTGRYYRWFTLLKAVILSATAMLYFSFATGARMLIVSGLLSLLVFLTIGIYQYFHGNRYTRYFVAGLLAFFTGWFLTGLQETGLLSGGIYIVFGNIGTVVMMGFISLSLTDRFNFMKDRIEKSRNEIIQVQRDYSKNLQSQVDDKTREFLAEKNRLEYYVKGMDAELEFARTIREKFISQRIPSAAISYIFHGAKNVGGNYLEFIELEEPGKEGILLADVTGSGIQAIFNILVLKTLVLEAESKKNDPRAMITHINEFLRKNPSFGYMIMIYCIYDSRTSELSYTNAGYIPPVIISGEIRPVHDFQGISLGVMDNEMMEHSDRHFTSGVIKIRPDERLVFFSEGFLRCLGDSGDAGLLLAYDLFAGLREKKLPEFIAGIEQAVSEKMQLQMTDDICLVALDANR